MAYKVKARFLENHAFGREEILNVLKATTNTVPDDIQQDDEGIVLSYSTGDDLEHLFTPAATSALYDADITLIQPRRFQAERTIFARRVSSWITEHEVDVILNSINRENENMTAVSAKIIANNNDTRSTLKVTFTTAAAADQATTTGFRCLGINTPPASVHKERFYEVSQCYKCYQYSHVTRKCPQSVNKCSVCAKDHHYKQCRADITCCVVCGGDHIAISHLCPVRQEEIKKLLTAGRASATARAQSPFNMQAAIFPELPGEGAAAHQRTNQWGPGMQSGSQPAAQSQTQPPPPPPGSSHSSTQTSPRQLPVTVTDLSTAHALTKLVSDITGSNYREFVRILNIIYKANGLQTIIVPDEVFPTSASASTSVTEPEITVNAAALVDLLSATVPPTTPVAADPTPDPVEAVSLSTQDNDPPAPVYASYNCPRDLKFNISQKRITAREWNIDYENGLNDDGTRRELWYVEADTVRYCTDVTILHPAIIDPQYYVKYPKHAAMIKKEIQERTGNEPSTQQSQPTPLHTKPSGTTVLVPDPSNPLSDDAPAPGPASDIAVNDTEPTAAATSAPGMVATQKPTTSHPPSPVTSPSTVHTSTEPSTSAVSPTAATKPSGTLLPRPTSPGMYSSDSSDEDVSVGTTSPPSQKYNYSSADFLYDAIDPTAMSTRSRTAKKDKSKTKTKDQTLLPPSRKK
nr:flocculation protein FLO11-like [Procambarus clarkii]